MPLPIAPADKANHYLYGSLAAAVGGLHSLAIGLVLCVVVAIGKEVHDRKTRTGKPELADALWTVAGGLVVLLPLAAWRMGWFSGV